MDKETIRLAYRQKRRSLSLEEIREFSSIIVGKILDFLEAHKEIRHVHLFLPIDRFHEVDTFPLFYTLQEKGYHIYTSQVNKGRDSLDTLEISTIKGFRQDNWGIPVPEGGEIIGTDKIQVVLVPLLAYDEQGYRIGYGKGYYDQYLAGFVQNVMKIGVSFFGPEKAIPVENHDIPLDICFTPFEVFTFKV